MGVYTGSEDAPRGMGPMREDTFRLVAGLTLPGQGVRQALACYAGDTEPLCGRLLAALARGFLNSPPAGHRSLTALLNALFGFVGSYASAERT